MINRLIFIIIFTLGCTNCYSETNFFSAQNKNKLSAKKGETRIKVTLNTEALANESLSIVTPQGRTIFFNRSPAQSGQFQSWRGKDDWRENMVVRKEGNNLAAIIHTSSASYLLQSNAGDSTLIENLYSDLPPQHSAEFPSGATGIIAPERNLDSYRANAAAANYVPNIRIAFGYTPSAVAYLTHNGNPTLSAQLLVDDFNNALLNSKARLTATLAGAMVIPAEYADDITAIRAAKSRADVIGFRNTTDADIFVIIADIASCGLSDSILARPDTAFVVVKPACTTYYTVSHEIGHLLGALHDRAHDNADYPIANAHGVMRDWTTPYDFSACWYTIMAYSSKTCYFPEARIPYFSNPAVSFAASGRVASTGNPTDNVVDFALNARGPYVALFRNTKLNPNSTGTLGDQIKKVMRIISSYLDQDR